METAENVRTAAFDVRKERFSAFLRNTDQKEIQLQATLHGLQQRAPTTWRKAIDPNQEFRAYFVGAGNGGLEIPFAKAIMDSRGTKNGLSIFCEDVSAPMKEEFLRNAEAAGLTETVKEYAVVPFENPTYAPRRADFSASSHVWYYVQNWKNVPRESNSLAKFQSTIQDGGVGLITLYSRQSDRYEILAYLHSLGKQSTPELPGEEIIDELQVLNIRSETNIVDAHTNVSACFQSGEFNPTDEGKLLLSFILRTYWNVLSEDVKASVGRKLTEITERNGRLQMIFRDLYVWIFPNKSSE
ncbi:MAG: hypothetical protein Q7S08_02580 [bacterium]|nr:hypothetical protein [bacterium]